MIVFIMNLLTTPYCIYKIAGFERSLDYHFIVVDVYNYFFL